MEQEPKFESWAIVEVMGHNTFAGKVTEQVVAGQGFIRVDVPEVPEDPNCSWRKPQPAFTKLIGPGSIYAITPCSEQVAKVAAGRVRVQPVEMLDIPVRRALTAPDDAQSDDDFPG